MPLPSKSVTAFFISAVLIIFGLLWLAYFYFMLGAVSPALSVTASEVEPVPVEKGEGVRSIAAKLEERGVIRSGSMMTLYSFLSGKAHQLKPGLYTISSASSTPEIVAQLVAGPSREIAVLIKEGDTLSEIDAKLTRLGVISKGELEKLAITPQLVEKYSFLKGSGRFEGFLFPDTYRFYFDSDAKDILEAFLDNFKKKVDRLLADSEPVNYDIIIVRLDLYSIKDILTIASMIEREVPDSEERRIISGIMYKRLKIGMPLQIDATTPYAEKYGERFDTYKFPGLPPSPIANPGEDAIEAALNPKPSPYLYYLSDPKTQKTIFAETFEQHVLNKRKYLQ